MLLQTGHRKVFREPERDQLRFLFLSMFSGTAQIVWSVWKSKLAAEEAPGHV